MKYYCWWINIIPIYTLNLCLIIVFILLTCREDEFVDLEAKFSPNILNTTVYIISMALQVSTFAVNYKVSSSYFKPYKYLYSLFIEYCMELTFSKVESTSILNK